MDEIIPSEEKCPTCGNLKEMYYTLWCPRCEKPKTQTAKIINLNKCLRYLEFHGRPHIHSRFWIYISDFILANDTIITLLTPEEYHEEMIEEEAYDFEIEEDLRALLSMADRDKTALWEVSW